MDRNALEQMLAQGQDNLMLRYTLGTLCFKEKSFEQAAEHLAAAVAHDPNHSASWKFYGRALAELEKNREAISAFSKGIEVAEARGDVQAAKEMKVFLKRLSKP
ncbi:MAG: hypothetical protein C0631_13755 [Sedimenticola sp.]|jgi:uncharacterized protein HemY|nr:MAG: hypothetical protein C0631_13755 [Sedimenticola sp.]